LLLFFKKEVFSYAWLMINPASARLHFHRMTTDDYDDCAAMWADPDTTRHIGGAPSTPEESWGRVLRCVGHWAALGYGTWVIRDRQTGRFAGDIGFKQFRRDLDPVLQTLPEIGWVLAPWARGQGLATEAATAALGWADAVPGWPMTLCIIDPENLASLRVAAKCGFAEQARTEYKAKPVIVFARQRSPA
jgi:RimJ/RimL family protein N-acetyltransferase